MPVLINDSLLTVVYRSAQFVPGIYSVGAYLVARPAARRLVWVIGLLVAAGLTAFATVAAVVSGIAVPRLLTASITLYAFPTVLALSTVDRSRRAQLSRWVGVLAIVAVCVAAHFLGHYVAMAFLGVVEVSA